MGQSVGGARWAGAFLWGGGGECKASLGGECCIWRSSAIASAGAGSIWRARGLTIARLCAPTWPYAVQKPIGKPKKIPFSSIKEIEELDCSEVRCSLRLASTLLPRGCRPRHVKLLCDLHPLRGFWKCASHFQASHGPPSIWARNVLSVAPFPNSQFVLQCGNRDYTFKAPDESVCTVLVHNLRQLKERYRLANL